MIKSTDGGANWLDEPTPKKSLWGIYFLNTNLGYAVGENGVILKYSIATSVKDPPQNIPARFSLEQNYPNPFNPSTNITFSLPSRSYVSLKVFELIGREVSTIIAGELPAGNYTRQWNAANMSSGVYFYRLQAGTFGETKKLMLLR
jgi:hypothetical protein